MAKTHFGYKFITPRHILMLHTHEEPEDDAWERYLSELDPSTIDQTGLLVFTGGGGPNAKQRGRLNDVLAGKHFARGIVTDSRIVRGIVTTLSWFAPGIKSYAPKEWELAAKHARFPEGMLPELRKEIRAMNDALLVPISWLDV